MCLLLLAWQVHPRHRLIVAANRDEFHERPSAPLSRWPSPDQTIAGGRDLRAGGTWLAVDVRGRFGAVTNYREPAQPRPAAPSRGELIPAFLRQSATPGDYLEALRPRAADYAGFNLLLADEGSLWYASNRADASSADAFARALPPGVYGLSNGLLDTPWPKLMRVREGFLQWLEGGSDPEALLQLLADRTQAGKAGELPLTGVDPAWEQTLSAPFVVHPLYGTRASTLVLRPGDTAESSLTIIERRFGADAAPLGTTRLQLPV